MQSPLFVTDALLSAAGQQLSQELAVARQDATTVSLVRSQLAAFRREMEKEGQLQVRVCWGLGRGGGVCVWDAGMRHACHEVPAPDHCRCFAVDRGRPPTPPTTPLCACAA